MTFLYSVTVTVTVSVLSRFETAESPDFPAPLFVVFLERLPVIFSVLRDPFRCVYLRLFFLSSFSSYTLFRFPPFLSSKPSPRFLALLVIRFHRCFRDLLFALLSVGPALLISSFSFVSLLFLPAVFYLKSHRFPVVWLAPFSFPPCFSFILVFLHHLWLPLHSSIFLQ